MCGALRSTSHARLRIHLFCFSHKTKCAIFVFQEKQDRTGETLMAGEMNDPAASSGVSDVFRHAGLDPASRFLLSGFRLSPASGGFAGMTEKGVLRFFTSSSDFAI